MRMPDSLRFAKPSKNTLSVSFCTRCNRDVAVIGDRCSICKDKIRVESKFKNNWTRCNQGQRHQSGLEASRCNELHLLQASGAVDMLQAHPQREWKLEVNGVNVTTYRADFIYRDGSGEFVVEDTKGWVTPEYRIKKALMLAVLGIEIREVRRARGERTFQRPAKRS